LSSEFSRVLLKLQPFANNALNNWETKMKLIVKKTILIAYVAIWIIALPFIWIYWNDFSWIQKALITMIEIFFAPDLLSLRPIFFKIRKKDSAKI
jgi:hypothetical protein